MRNLLLALFCAGSFACATAQAANNDLVEFGLGARLLFDSNTYAANNPAVNYDTDVFPIVGDQAFGFGFNAAIGHRYNSRRGPYEVLIKYIYSTSPKDKGTATVTVDGLGEIDVDMEGSLNQHDLLLTFRLPGELMPLPILNWNQLYYDLGMGVSTLSYTFDVVGGSSDSDVVRSGLAYNFGVGWRHEFDENTALTLRTDFVLGKIQDIKDASGQLVHAAPGTNGARLEVGLVRYFKALF